MSHREDLLEGAKRCIREKGYAGTTARDIVSASGTNLASIGYHYGSKEALLNQALIELTGEWGEALDRVMAEHGGATGDPIDRFAGAWEAAIELLDEYRWLWVATFEVLDPIEHSPELRKAFDDIQQLAWTGLAALTHDSDDPDTVRVVGSFNQAVLLGLMALHLIYPANAPSGTDMADALRRIAGGR
jgi:AcrR family transcriptional regulator